MDMQHNLKLMATASTSMKAHSLVPERSHSAALAGKLKAFDANLQLVQVQVDHNMQGE